MPDKGRGGESAHCDKLQVNILTVECANIVKCLSALGVNVNAPLFTLADG